MNRLPYALPEWCRTIWSSESIRAEWEPRVRAAARAFEAAALEDTLAFGRKSAIVVVSPGEFPALTMRVAERGCAAFVLEHVPAASSYTSSGRDLRPGEPYRLRCVVTRRAGVEEWIKATDGGCDHRAIGKLLGYPPCCVESFVRHWVDEKWLDTSWPMYQASGRVAEGPVHCNILLRWVGVRLVSHLPCSFGCYGSEVIGHRTENLMRHRLGLCEAADDILRLLDMPIEWTALHGIAEIKTPLFKISARTDASAEKYVIHRQGSFYPPEAPSGRTFPYRNAQRNQVTAGRSFRDSVAAVAGGSSTPWVDSGFSSSDAMQIAHDQLLADLAQLGVSTDDVDSVVDLGCGSGTLLHRIVGDRRGVVATGVEVDRARAARAQVGFPLFVIYQSDAFGTAWHDRNYALGLIGSNRLVEQAVKSHTSIASVLDLLAPRIETLVVYGYGDARLTGAQVRDQSAASDYRAHAVLGNLCVLKRRG